MSVERKRINVRRLFWVTVLCLFLPLVVGVTIDVAYGIAPAATLIAGLLTIPVASVVVSRVALTELTLIIDQIAPEDDFQGELSIPESVAAAAKMLPPGAKIDVAGMQLSGNAGDTLGRVLLSEGNQTE